MTFYLRVLLLAFPSLQKKKTLFTMKKKLMKKVKKKTLEKSNFRRIRFRSIDASCIPNVIN